MLQVQKLTYRRKSQRSNPKYQSLLEEYRSSIILDDFSLKQIEVYDSLSNIELQNIEISTIQHKQLRELIVDALKLTFIFDPLEQTLQSHSQQYFGYYPIKTIVRILLKGEFYRFVNNSEYKLTILINNRTTEANVKIIIASLLIHATRKLRIEDLSTSTMFFSLEASLSPDPLTLPADSQKIIKVLKKIERVIKPNYFKRWLEAVKASEDFCGSIEIHQFLYLISLSQKKFGNGLQNIIFQPKISSLFKNFSINSRASEFQSKKPPESVDKKIHIRGLSLVEPRQKSSFSFSKEILKEFRLRDPSKNKRPHTKSLRKRVQSFCLVTPPVEQPGCKDIPFTRSKTSNNTIETPQSSNPSVVMGKLSKSVLLKKPTFKLRLNTRLQLRP